MGLKLLNSVHTSTPLDLKRKSIIFILVSEVLRANIENISKALQRNDHTSMVKAQTVHQSLDDILLDQLVELLGQGVLCRVTQSPNCLLAHFNLIFAQQ